MEKNFVELAEKLAIYELMARYAERIDAKDPTGAAACFKEDGVGDYWGEVRGRAAIAERLAGILAGFTATSHHLSNVMIELDGDHAKAMAYVYAFHRRIESGEDLHVWGRWVDSLEKVGGQWLFAHRKVVLVGSKAPNGSDDAVLAAHPGRLP